MKEAAGALWKEFLGNSAFYNEWMNKLKAYDHKMLSGKSETQENVAEMFMKGCFENL